MAGRVCNLCGVRDTVSGEELYYQVVSVSSNKLVSMNNDVMRLLGQLP